ncbi:hypothetical protein HGA88_07070 [Candidatus Roizmanbacteria bacterium]|nr:hypothetical protein [Candidatus Roizmanbacteria bacterium]
MKFKVKDAKQPVNNPEVLYQALLKVWKTFDYIARQKEYFWVIHLTTRNMIKSLEIISVGTLDASLVHPREVFVRAIKEHSYSIIVAHNHPSGNPEPSEEDINITKRLQRVSETIGIPVLDHIVYTDQEFVSLKNKGYML